MCVQDIQNTSLDLAILPDDIIRKIRKLYFESYLKPSLLSNSEFIQVIGCRRRFFTNSNYDDYSFLEKAINWLGSYVNSFDPEIASCESLYRGGPQYREYHKHNKYCWVDSIYICVDDFGTESVHDTMSLLKAYLQNLNYNVFVRARQIKLDLKVYENYIYHILQKQNIPIENFEWKSLNFHIDFKKQIAYFTDSCGQSSRFIYIEVFENYDHAEYNKNYIPWFVYFP